jgi:DNA excision repair protein ERCC-2
MRLDTNGRYAIAVRSLCDFTAKAGDLDLRFTPAPLAREGVEGHAAIARRRGSDYETEIVLEGEYEELKVRGRADGYDPADNRLEEFKTYRGDLGRMPASHRAVHWAQLRMYGALLCRLRGLSELRLALVYYNLKTQIETPLIETRTASELEAFFAEHCGRFLGWARQQIAHRAARDAATRALQFPFATFHTRQREVAEKVYRTVTHARTLLMEAPTGSGKTLGALFPALKALQDKIFFLVAKTSGRALVLEALARVLANTPREAIRVVELVARDKACERPGAECDGTSCPFARGFYDRLPQARAEAVERAVLDRSALRDVALRNGICPYYLGQEMVRWADVIVGDYNYYFDVNALLPGLAVANQWTITLLVDEAHNLVERARAMFSSELRRDALDQVRKASPAPIARSLDKLAGRWNSLAAECDGAYHVHASLPEDIVEGLSECIGAIGDFSAEQPVPPELLDWYFEAIHFTRLAARFDQDTVCESREALASLSLRNVVPAPFLSEKWRAAHASVLFSATLTPFDFYRDILGLPKESTTLAVGTPFTPDQLSVRVVRSISTRWRDRERSIRPIVRLIERQYRAQPGNYLAFFSSYRYLQDVAAGLACEAADIPSWCQEAAMAESRRAAFLDRFQPDGQGVGFAVLGGAFAEGIDLPGARLIGAFVATLGLPQTNPANEETQRRIENRFGDGYGYTYLYPGLRKVVQAAGRVIRTVDDRGVVYLIDDRFTQPRIRSLLPSWWVLEEGRP